MVESQPELPLKAMFESITTQQQGSMSMLMTHITTRKHGMSQIRTATGDHTNAQGLRIIGHSSHRMQCSKNWSHLSPAAELKKASLVSQPDSTVELDLVAWVE